MLQFLKTMQFSLNKNPVDVKIKKVDESDEKAKNKNTNAGRKARTGMKRARDMKQRLTGTEHYGPNVTNQMKS